MPHPIHAPAPAEATASFGPAQLALLQRYGGKHGERLLAGAAAAQLFGPLAQRVYRHLRRRDDFTITVPATDDIYPALHEWVLGRMPDTDRKALIATTASPRRGHLHPSDVMQERPRVRLRYDGDREQRVSIDGHRVDVS